MKTNHLTLGTTSYISDPIHYALWAFRPDLVEEVEKGLDGAYKSTGRENMIGRQIGNIQNDLRNWGEIDALRALNALIAAWNNAPEYDRKWEAETIKREVAAGARKPYIASNAKT